MRMTLLAGTALAMALPSLALAQDRVEAEIIPLAEWNYDDLYADGISVDEMIGSDVNGPTGDDIGDVENVLFDDEGRVLSVIAEVGGFFELGDTHVNIPWEMVQDAVWGEGITIPFTQDTIEDYTLFNDTNVTQADTDTVQEVEGDGADVADTGPRVWRATDLIGDTARLRHEGTAVENYGYVDDLILRDGRIAAVVVNPDVTRGAGGYYAYPYHAYDWEPGGGYYDLPYNGTEIEPMEPFDPERIGD